MFSIHLGPKLLFGQCNIVSLRQGRGYVRVGLSYLFFATVWNRQISTTFTSIIKRTYDANKQQQNVVRLFCMERWLSFDKNEKIKNEFPCLVTLTQ